MTPKAKKPKTKEVRANKEISWHVKIAQSRGEDWRRNMIKGRRDVVLNPSVLRIERIQKNLNQSDLAEKLGLTKSTFGAIERGKRPVKAQTAQMISKLVGRPLKTLFKPSQKGKFVALLQKS